MIYFTSDHHFGHANIIDFSGRPFDTVDEMNEGMIEAWNDTVGPNDDVYYLGDFAMGKIAKTLPLGQRLNGNKLLVPGNHDRCWKGNAYSPDKVDEWRIRYISEAGFVAVLAGESNTRVRGRVVELCHFPYFGADPDDLRHVEHRPHDYGGWLIHGHIHNNHETLWADGRVNDRMINVSVDVWDFKPVSADQILAIIEESEAS